MLNNMDKSFRGIAKMQTCKQVLLRRVKRRSPGELGVQPRLAFYEQQPVVLGHAVRTAQRTCFDLRGGCTDAQIGNSRVFRFTRPVRDD